MKKLICILVLLFQLLPLQSEQQENAVAPPRTPEQEADMQTNKMRSELGLSSDQAKTIYEINLRHARERQTSTSRSEALKRVKHKEEELQRVLNQQQYNKLQEKRTDYNQATREVDAVVHGRTRPITNPQRIESGKSVRSRNTNSQPNNTQREGLPSQRTSPSSRSYQGSSRERDGSPTTRSAEAPEQRRSQPEGTRYIPERESSSTRSASPASNQSGRSTNSSGTRSSSGGSSSGSRSSSGNRR